MSFLSLGWRPGIVVAIAIPLVLAITFVAMKLAGVSLPPPLADALRGAAQSTGVRDALSSRPALGPDCFR